MHKLYDLNKKNLQLEAAFRAHPVYFSDIETGNVFPAYSLAKSSLWGYIFISLPKCESMKLLLQNIPP